jgi:putative transposase
MCASRARQPLTYDVRLPDEAQADALRLLDASRAVINQALKILWPSLDECGERSAGPAWKQVGQYLGSPQPHGDRQWRCESEGVGRLLRQQADRKKAFLLVAPILTDGFIGLQTESRPAGKNQSVIKEAITTLQKSLEDDDPSFITLQHVIEQCCNFYFQQDRWPLCYAELQPVPLLKVGMLTYAGDDGREKGPASRLAVDQDAGVARLRFRYPDETGVWRKVDTIFSLPECLKARLPDGELMAPTLREEQRADWGIHSLLTADCEQVGRPFFLNAGGFDGKQARTRRQIDELQKKIARFERERDALPADHPKRAWYQERLAL